MKNIIFKENGLVGVVLNMTYLYINIFHNELYNDYFDELVIYRTQPKGYIYFNYRKHITNIIIDEMTLIPQENGIQLYDRRIVDYYRGELPESFINIILEINEVNYYPLFRSIFNSNYIQHNNIKTYYLNSSGYLKASKTRIYNLATEFSNEIDKFHTVGYLGNVIL